MAGVVENKPSTEQREAAAQDTRQMESALLQKLTSTFDPTAGLVGDIDKAIKKESAPEPVEEESVEQPETDETTDATSLEDKSDSEDADGEESPKASEEEDEDLIPKSKVQKRIDELTREKRRLEAELSKTKRDYEEKSSTKKDPDLEKLEAMTVEELRAVKKQVRLAQIQAHDDPAKVGELMELEDKIESVAQTAPERFQKTQVTRFYDAVEQTKAELGEDFEKSGDSIFKYAQTIFNSAPELKSNPNGQARAWSLAVEHYKELSKISTGKSKVSELERQVNTLKKKVSLDSTSVKGNTKANDDAKAFRVAKHGSLDQKMDFFKRKLGTDNLIPDEYRQSR